MVVVTVTRKIIFYYFSEPRKIGNHIMNAWENSVFWILPIALGLLCFQNFVSAKHRRPKSRPQRSLNSENSHSELKKYQNSIPFHD